MTLEKVVLGDTIQTFTNKVNSSIDKVEGESDKLGVLTSQVGTQYQDTNAKIQSLASGSPKGAYTTLTALQTAFPTGATGIYIVSTGATAGHWYYWSGSVWTDGGVYQATAIPTGSITTEKFASKSVTGDKIWDNAVLSEQLGKANMNIYNTALDIPESIIDNSFIYNPTTYNSSPLWYVSHKIPVKGSRTYFVPGIPSTQTVLGGWYNSSDVLLSVPLCAEGVGSFNITAPATATYFRFNIFKTSKITSLIDLIGTPAVKTDNLLDKSVTTEKIGTEAVTYPKLPKDLAHRAQSTMHDHAIDFLKTKDQVITRVDTSNVAYRMYPPTPSNTGNVEKLILNLAQGYKFNVLRFHAVLVDSDAQKDVTFKVYKPKTSAVYVDGTDLITSVVVTKAELSSHLKTLSAGVTEAGAMTEFGKSYVEIVLPLTVANDQAGGVDILIQSTGGNLPTIFCGTSPILNPRGFYLPNGTVLHPWSYEEPLIGIEYREKKTTKTAIEEVVKSYMSSSPPFKIDYSTLPSDLSDGSINTKHRHKLDDNTEVFTIVDTVSTTTVKDGSYPFHTNPIDTADNTVNHHLSVIRQGEAFSKVRLYAYLMGDNTRYTSGLVVKVYKHSSTYTYNESTDLLATGTISVDKVKSGLRLFTKTETSAYYLAEIGKGDSYVDIPLNNLVLNDQVGGVDLVITTTNGLSLPQLITGSTTTGINSVSADRFQNKATPGNWMDWGVNTVALDLIEEATRTLNTTISLEVDKTIDEYMRVNAVSSKQYFDVAQVRAVLAPIMEKLHNKEQLRVVVYGDSIVNFQNSEMLTVAEQKTAPIGLAGNSFVRQLWQMLNYDTFNDNRSFRNINGNMGFKRYDHADSIFSNGYEGTTAALGTKDWGTNLKATADTWRDSAFSGHPSIVTPESSYNKPYVGTRKNGANYKVTVPADSIGFSIVIGKGQLASTSVRIQVNNGTSDVIDETFDSNALVGIETHRDYSVTPGTIKTITVTNLADGRDLWIWGVEYWSKNCVRVFNSGLAGNTSLSLNSGFNQQVSHHNPNLVILENAILNDSQSSTLAGAYTNIKALYVKLKALNIPVVSIATHRFLTGLETIQYDRDNIIYGSIVVQGTNIIGVKHFFPDFVKLVKHLTLAHGFALIDMYTKSSEELGRVSKNGGPTMPTGYFVDNGHLGPVGNKSYVDELKKAFLWHDID